MLQWNQESIPSVGGNVLGPPGIDIKDIAIASDGITIWAAPGATVPFTIFKSTNSGITWTAVPANVVGLTSINADLIAVAPDNNDFVAICDTTTLIVYVSTNGGATWNTLGTIQEGTGATANSIKDLDISPTAMGINYLAVCGDDSGGLGNIWYFNVGATTPAWRETNDLAGFNETGYHARSVDAIAFSPNFPSDLTMLAITSNATDNIVKLEILSYSGRAWNSYAGFPSEYPIDLSARMSNPNFTAITKASIALDPEYLGSDGILRNAFIGLTLTGDEANSGIIRTKDVLAEDIKLGINIYSIAYDGATLVAGATDAKIYRCKDPLATISTFHSTSSLKKPGGMKNAVVGFAGTVVFAGTTGPMSAFAVSIDDGASFNDISLIDTALTVLEDVAISSDGSIIYLVTNDAFNTSVWRHDSTWKRILSLTGVPVCLVRIAPDNPDAIYIVSTTSTAIYFSRDGGNTKWTIRASRYDIHDLAVESEDVAYIAVDGSTLVSKTTNSGFTWGTGKPSLLFAGTIHTIVSLSKDNLLVGSTAGYVSYSTDGNSTWNLIPKVVGSVIDQINVTADGLVPGNNIYAVCSITAGVYRWTIGQPANELWLQIDDAVPGTGIVLKNDVLYESSSAGVVRRSVLSTLVFDNISTGTLVFNTTPSALRVSATDFIRLWAIDTATMMLYSLVDISAPVEPIAPGEPIPIEYKLGFNLTEMRFFISYCDNDGLKLASSAAKILEESGSQTWYFDRDKTTGMWRIVDITEHIRSWCNKIIYICTTGSIYSEGQWKEIGQWDNTDKQLIVIQIDGATVPEVIDSYIYERMLLIRFEEEFSIFARNRLEEIINKWEEDKRKRQRPNIL